MKKELTIGIISALFILGCSSKTETNVMGATSVTQMMTDTQVVGWTDYKKDTDNDRVPDYKDRCPNTPAEAPVDSKGCALDTDADGVADYQDYCPNTPVGISVDRNGCGVDTDKDKVPDYKDKCPNTPVGLEVDNFGCALDRDKDGIADYLDRCSNTPHGAIVDDNGCSLDGDKDGVADGLDKCPNTPRGASVDKNGCALDTDKDGVIDLIDKCPNTESGVVVDEKGCPLDTDKDGVPNINDKCPDTPLNVKVNFEGCPVIAEFRFNFQFNSSKIAPTYYPQIQKLADILKNNPAIKIEIQGFTDNVGAYLYNKELSLKRANALRDILIKKFHIQQNRISIIGYGSDHPIANNSTPEGQALNRRIVVIDRTNNLLNLNNNVDSNTTEDRGENLPPQNIDR